MDQKTYGCKSISSSTKGGGIGYLASNVHDYLETKGTGRKAARPKPVQWRK
jgi:hypothetical protein